MQRRAFLLGVAAAAFGSACGGSSLPQPTPNNPQPPQPPNPPDPGPVPVVVPVCAVTRFLCFGDSMTEGTTSPPLSVLTSGIPQSYPFKLQDLETARYTNQTMVVLNAGLAGQRVDDPQTQPRMDQAIKEGRPEVLFLMDGANDLLALERTTGAALTDGISKAVNAMEDLVRDGLNRGTKVIVMTLPPQRASGLRGGAAPFLNRYNDQLKTMAAKKGAQVVDVNALFPLSLVGQDGLHLTEAGNQQLAEIMRDAIAQMFDVRT